MKLVRTTFFSAIITVIRISSGFISGKFIALLTGTAGVALLGAFSNFITIVLTLANGAISSGVVKYTAEFDEDESKLRTLFSTALRVSIFCSLIIGAILVALRKYISIWVFASSTYSALIVVLGLTIIFYSINTLLISILNGKGQIKTFTIVNTLGSLVGLVLTIVLVYFFKIQGALYSLVLAQSIVCFVTVCLIVKSKWFKWDFFSESINKLTLIKLSHYSLMTVVTAITLPLAQIFLRGLIIDKLGISAAGYWQGMMRVSDGYLLLIVTSLSTYYMPKLSSLKENYELRIEIFKGYKLILPVVLLGCAIIYLLRFSIIKLLYTPDFFEMEGLFLWQLVGDFFKMAAWILSYLMLAKAMTKTFIITEVIFNLGYVVLGYFFIPLFGLKGVSIAFAVTYVLYLICMIIVFRKLLFGNIFVFK